MTDARRNRRTVNTDPLPVSTPAAQGVAANCVQAFLDVLETTPGADPHSLMILRHGHVIVSGWWWPYTPERLHLLYSLSKSFTSTAASLAVADGLLRLDEPVIAYFPELDAKVTDARARSMLVRHVASMASGHLDDTWQQVMSACPDEPVRGFLLVPPDRDPGSVFAYNQSATYTLAAIVQRLTGQTLTQYLRHRLLDPLGAGEVSWQQHPVGRDIGFSGMFATTDTIARLGQFYLQRGAWKGQQYLAAERIAEATHPHISTRSEPTTPEAATRPDWQQGYGFQFWMSRHGYRGDGAFGQFCLILPEQDAVVAMTAQTDDMQAVLDAVWDKLLPAFGETTGADAESDALLEDRLDRLAVPAFQAQPTPPAGHGTWADETFVPSRGTCEQQPSLLGVRVTTDRGDWRVTLSEADWHMNARFHGDGWAVTEPVTHGAEVVPTACLGGWIDPGTLRFDVIFLETPHRLVVTCKLPERTFDAQWTTAPLFTGRLRDLHSPDALVPSDPFVHEHPGQGVI